MRHFFLTLILSLFSLYAFAQHTKYAAAGTPLDGFYSRGDLTADSSIMPPLFADTPTYGRARRTGSIIREYSTGDTLVWQFTGTQWSNITVPSSTPAQTVENPNLWTKLRMSSTPILAFAPYENVTQYEPEPIYLPSGNIAMYSKGDATGMKTVSSYISTNNGLSFTFQDTLISITPSDTAFSYNQIQQTATIPKTVGGDSLVILFTASIFASINDFNIAYATVPVSDPYSTIPKSRIRRIKTCVQVSNDFGLLDADYCAVNEIVRKEGEDTAHIFIEVVRGINVVAANPYSYIVHYKTVDWITYTPVSIALAPQKPSFSVWQISIYKYNGIYYGTIAESTSGYTTNDTYLRHVWSNDLVTWNDVLEGRFMEALGYNNQVSRVYCGQWLVDNDGTNTTLKMYGDTARYYYSSSFAPNDRAFLANVFPGTQDGFIQDNQRPVTMMIGGNYRSDNNGLFGATTSSQLTLLSGGRRAIYLRSNGQVRVGLSVSSPGIHIPAVNGTPLEVADSGHVNLPLHNSSSGLNDLTDGLGLKLYQGTLVGELFNRENAALTFGTNNTERMRISSGGNVGVRTNVPDAYLHIGAGTATAGTASLKLNAGTFLTTPETGAIEFSGTSLTFTPSATRLRFALTNNVTPAVGEIPIGNGSAYTITALSNTSTTPISATGGLTLTSPYTFRQVDATLGVITLTITPTYAGQIFTIKKTDVGVNVVTVQMASGNIDGSASHPLAALNESITVIWDGANGWISQ